MIYLDNHATTPLDPEALEAMLPLLRDQFANPGSTTHQAGRDVANLVSSALQAIANCIGAQEDEVVFTSGATESNNLAVAGICLHPRQKRRKVISVATEHPALIDPIKRLEKHGFEVCWMPVYPQQSETPGRVDLECLLDAIDEDTALVSIMLANNEIGTLQPLRDIADCCHGAGAILHSDATQAVGRLPVDVGELGVDLLSFSAHKFYGPKGVGGLYVHRRERRVRLAPQIVGGGQQQNIRSGTLNAPGIVGMAKALEICCRNLGDDSERITSMRNQLWSRIQELVPEAMLNGPAIPIAKNLASLSKGGGSLSRLPGNLNVSFLPIEGQSLMLELPELAVSSGSACASADPSPSHVLTQLGLSEDRARSSIRFGVGRMNTMSEMETVANWIHQAVIGLRTRMGI